MIANDPSPTRNRLLIVGAGDIARRALPQLRDAYCVTAMVRNAGRARALEVLGASPLLADLDRPQSLGGLPAARCLLHAAPPQGNGSRDERTRNLVAALDAVAAGSPERLPRRVVYVSTSGVYGDCAGALVDEQRLPRPGTDRARRRCDAERVLAEWSKRRGATLIVLRAPGIYGRDRVPLERLRQGTPVLVREDDVYTNHIHADDLAAICVAALDECVPGGVYNAVDDSEILMGDWLDLVADAFGLQRPPRIRRGEARTRIPAPLLTFMGESRRLVNTRLKRDMGYVLRYPTVAEGVHEAASGRKAA
jgi:nucleoside-diphosphate-sugar epimerase